MALHRIFAVCALVVAVPACATPVAMPISEPATDPAAEPIVDLPPGPFEAVDADACALTDRGALVLITGNRRRLTLVTQVEAGDAVALSPAWTPYPSAITDVPPHCFDRWSVSDPALASFSGDHGQLIVAADASVGASFTVTAHFAGRMVRTHADHVRPRTIEQRFEVIRRITSPLVGTWRPVAGTCAPGTAITGLALRDTGRFEVETIMRPNHYQPSAAGTWRVEGDRLLLTPEYASDGNGGPSADFQNEARFTLIDGTLRFDRTWHGSVEGIGTCNAPLTRVP